jgi:D-beta-D-heptose 7-phosphate kinase/D-beta-D-heptose 1-phosphate adenosyltransferase
MAVGAGAEGRTVRVIVDPKLEDFSRYRGCHAITPNQREAETAARMTISAGGDLQEAARRIRETCGAPWILVTRGDKGMAVCGPDDELVEIPARAREVFDVTGAGDIVMAYFGLGVGSGLAPLEASTIANLAAGIGVGKVGTATVSPAEILAFETQGRFSIGKIATAKDVAARIGRERSLGRKIVFTNGCFDLLHAGHVHLLESARQLGDFLVVAVNSDASVRRLKGEGRPVLSQDDRVKILSALDAVDMVVLFDEDTPIESIRLVRPDVLVKGGDYVKETIVGYDFVTAHGGRIETIPLVAGRSTTGLIETLGGRKPDPDTKPPRR